MDNWSEYQKLVIHRLDSSDRHLASIDQRLRTLETRFERVAERLAVTAAFLGFAAGTIPVVMGLVF